MKIAVFECREDEKPYLKTWEEQNQNLQLVLCPQLLNAETVTLLKGCEAVSVLGWSHLQQDLLEQLKCAGVKYLSTRTIGFNHIDVDAAHRVGIRVCNASYQPNGVADFTIMMMLLSLRNYKPAMWRQNVNDYSLGGLMGRELRSLTVGVVGTGQVGAQVVRSLAGFGCKVLAYNRTENRQLAPLADFVSLAELYAQSDIITLHVPLSEETRHMVDAAALACMKDGVVLINTARGELMQLEALTQGVESGKIGALAMDVFENEQGIYHIDHKTNILKNRDMVYLRQFPNVVLTQHMAFYTEEAIHQMVDFGIGGLLEMAKGPGYKNEL